MTHEQKYRDAYNQGQPIVPDDIYDDMFGTEETTLDDQTGAGELVPHLHPMLSLPTFFEDVENLTYQRLKELGFKGIFFENECCGTVSYKLDGVAISAVYDAKSYKLVRLVSRGKRTAGFVLNSAWNKVFPQIKEDVALPYATYDFRGELVISKDDFERINATMGGKYANARSMIAANVNALEPNLDVVNAAKLLMHAVWTDDEPALHFSQLDFIFDKEHIAPHQYLIADECNTPERIIDTVKTMYTEAMNYYIPCDGIVIQTAITDANNGRANLDRIAIKQMDEAKYSAETKVKNIAWRLANDGHYFPHIEFETVEINGADVNHAAGYCYDYLKRMNISIGASVIVTMRGGVIPKVTSVLSTGTGNLNLPTDIAPIEENDIHVWSTNSAEAIQRLKFIRGMAMLNLENCGTELFADMYDAGYHTLFDVAEQVKQGIFGIRMLGRVLPDTLASNAKVLTIIDRFKTFNYVWLILALRFNNVGFKAADFIGQYISGYELVDYSMLKHKAVKAVLDNVEVIAKIKQYANSVAQEHATLAKINDKPASNKPKVILSKKPSNGMTKAQFIETFLQDYDVTENVREANLLVCPAGETSNKINYAKANNITIKHYEDFV